MRWREAVTPVAMSRVAIAAPAWALRDALVRVADEGTVELDRIVPAAELPVGDAARALQRLAPAQPPVPELSLTPVDLDELQRSERAGLLAGEVAVAEQAAQAVTRGDVSALVGWMPTDAMPGLAARLTPVGAAVAPLPRPRGVQPPTAAGRGATHRAFAPLVTTYGTVPYADVDPTVLAGVAYAVMFGAMFGDLGHGALLLLGALLVRSGRPRRLAGLRPHWLFIAASAVSAMLFGLAYGEFFGPTGVLPGGLIAPMEQPVPMLAAGITVGVVLLAGAYALGTINRVREGGWALALYAPSGVAGTLLFVAAGAGAAAWWWHSGWAGIAAALIATTGLVLAYVGLFAAAGGGAAGALQAGVEVLDLVIRLGANVVSFARLAAFGLTHAVLGWAVWQATTALWGAGAAGAVGAVAVFVGGNALAFGLEGLVAGIQALRLEYYELFSRVFQLEGRPFRPWHIPIAAAESTREAPCPPGFSPHPPSPSPALAR